MFMLSVRINIIAFIITMTLKLGAVCFLIKMRHYENVVFQKFCMKGRKSPCYLWIERLHLTHHVRRMLCFNWWTSPTRVQQQQPPPPPAVMTMTKATKYSRTLYIVYTVWIVCNIK